MTIKAPVTGTSSNMLDASPTFVTALWGFKSPASLATGETLTVTVGASDSSWDIATGSGAVTFGAVSGGTPTYMAINYVQTGWDAEITATYKRTKAQSTDDRLFLKLFLPAANYVYLFPDSKKVTGG